VASGNVGADDEVAATKRATVDASENDVPKSRVEALRAKLRAKIAEKRAQRPVLSPDQVSKRAARRAAKRRKQEQNKKKSSSSSVVGASTPHSGGSSSSSAAAAAATSASSAVSMSSRNSLSDAAIMDQLKDLAHVDYGRLSGLRGDNISTPTGTPVGRGGSRNYLEMNKALANVHKSKNYKKMLEDSQKKREKIRQLQRPDATDEEKEELRQIQWSDALHEADGTRVKDDPNKIKKILQRKAAKKAKSQKAWKSRMEQQMSAQEEKQRIRKQNIEARKIQKNTWGSSAALGTNTAQGTASGTATGSSGRNGGGRALSRAGFEGRKQGFLNGPKKPTVTATGTSTSGGGGGGAQSKYQ
jgi:hypothetical protein